MADDSPTRLSTPPTALKRLRQLVTLGALMLALCHLVWPWLAIDAITLGLLVIAILPWLAPIFKTLEFPGGWKVEFQDLQKVQERAEQAGLLSPSPTADQTDYAFTYLGVLEDPNLALAGLRIEIERRLVALAKKHGIPAQGGLGQLLRLLSQAGVLGNEERAVLADLVGLLNSAVHGAEVDKEAAFWAITVGTRLLGALDELVNRAREPEKHSR